MNKEQQLQLEARISFAFTPGAPIDQRSLFAGRSSQLDTILKTIFQRGQHVIIYGERGVGKTSIANIIAELMGGLESKPSVAKVNCDAKDTFSSLWNKILREVTFVHRVKQMGFKPEETAHNLALNNLLPEDVKPDDIRYVFQHVHPQRALIIVDEVDRIRDSQTTTLLADTIKTLSDYSLNVTVVLVGVADSVVDLISEHDSISRSLVQVRMPRMAIDELYELLDTRFSGLEMAVDKQVISRITRISQGLPHYTHLLAQASAEAAVRQDRTNITLSDFNQAVKIAVQNAHQSIINAYQKATSSARQTLHSSVLLACALAPRSDDGFFTTADVRKPLSDITNRPYEISAYSGHLHQFCEPERGPVLQKKGHSQRFRFRFKDPLMEPFVLINGIDKGLLSSETIQKYSESNEQERLL